MIKTMWKGSNYECNALATLGRVFSYTQHSVLPLNSKNIDRATDIEDRLNPPRIRRMH